MSSEREPARWADRWTTGRWGLAALLLLTSGCECGDDGPGLERLQPELVVEPARIDFGQVPVGATRHAAVSLSNPGGAVLTIDALIADPPFLGVLSATEIPSGGRAALDLSVTATVAGEILGTVQVRSDAKDLPALAVSVRAEGVAGYVDVLPNEVRFDATPVGTSRAVELVVQNGGLEAIEGRLVTDSFFRPEHFTLSGVPTFGAPAAFTIGPQSTVSLELVYRPVAEGEDGGVIRIETCGVDCGLEVPVSALAVGAQLELDPAFFDFGAVGLDERRSTTIQLVNKGDVPVDLTEVEVRGAAEFTVDLGGALPRSLPGQSNLPIVIDFRPTQAILHSAELIVRTTHRQSPELVATLGGRGEGPLFLVQPESLDFGLLTRLATARRAVVLLNAGSTAVQVRSVSLAGAPDFSLGLVPGLPHALGAGEALSVTIEMTPRAEGERTAALVVESDDPARGRVEVPIRGAYSPSACQLELSPSLVNFGLVPPGFTRTRPLRLTNPGTGACVVVASAIDPPDPALRAPALTLPLTIDAGQTLDVELAFAPTDRRDVKSGFVLTTSDALRPERRVGLLASSRAYDGVLVLPEHLDFGLVPPMCGVERREVTIYNTGTRVETVAAATVRTDQGEPFVLDASFLGGQISAGNHAKVRVNYAPTRVGSSAGELELVFADRPYPIVVPLRGQAVEATGRTDRFEQAAPKKADILFVFDDSCSMYDEQVELARNFEAFIRAASNRQVDFQIGVTTTSILRGGARAPGEFVGPILEDTDGALVAKFTDQVKVGIGGSPFEAGLEAMRLAFELDDRDVRPNDGFLRPGSTAIVVFVSDEDDQSPLGEAHYLRALTDAADPFIVAGITGGPNGCGDGMTRYASPTPRYMAFLALTQGHHASICAPDWGVTLGSIGQSVFGLPRSFRLTKPADPAHPVRVRIDGVEVTSGWTIDPSREQIHFDTPPPEGAEIEVEYVPIC